jgi:HEAT repeat protein
MLSSPCCCWCGAVLPGGAGQADALLCPSCCGRVAAVPPPPTAPAAPPPPPPVANRPAAVNTPGPRASLAWPAAAALAAGVVLTVVVVVLSLVPRTRPFPAPADEPAPELLAAPQPDPGDMPAAPEGPTPAARASQPRLYDIPADARAGLAPPAAAARPTPPGKSAAGPAPTAPAAAPAAALKRRDTSTEGQLREHLALAPEVGLGAQGQAVLLSYAADWQTSIGVTGAMNLTDATPLLKVRPDVGALPLRYGTRCQLPDRKARELEVLSRRLRVYLNQLATPGPDGQRPTPAQLREVLRTETAGRKPAWLRPEAVPALVQLLMGEEAPLRRALVEVLAEVPGPQAAAALAQRAAFDLDAGVRDAAVEALRGRPAGDYQDVLLKALRYPWAPPAEHAAEALVALKVRAAVPTLVTLLKLPDPAGPLPLNNGRVVLQEVVRANHLTNCLLCHPPAATAAEPALGLDPVVTVPPALQPSGAAGTVAGTPGAHAYNSSGSGIGARAGGGSGAVPALIRGDITFLRQDFSVALPITPAGRPALRPPALPGVAPGQAAPPATLRYDFVLRTRVLSRKETALVTTRPAGRPDYPQREAVLFALRELTGQDAGPTAEAWQELFPRAEVEVRGARLARDLLRADPLRREMLLNRYRDTKGAAYTHALAGVIAGFKGAEKEKAREALAQRLTRMTADTLRDKFADEDAEVRHAAVAACARKRDRSLLPDLIALLEGPEPLTARLAEESLDELTGQHFPHPAAWKEWWKKNGAAAEGPAAGG